MNSSYSGAGVRSADEMPGFKRLLQRLAPTFGFAPDARPVIDFGYYANVVPVAPNLGIAISTDGVGTKILVAEALGKFDTIGIDCVAMNVNDIICVGARPVSMVDYIAVQDANRFVEENGAYVLDDLGKGFAEGARQSGISIPGGELAQVPEMIQGERPGGGLDLVGTAIGTVALDRVLTGKHLRPGDAIVGLASSGIHSNGFTLARLIFSDLGEYVPELGRTAGEELLEPTRIYVGFANELLASGTEVEALAHITGDGFLNLSRVEADVTFDLQSLPEPPAIFSVLKARGGVADEEMFRVYNMGVGFVVVVPAGDLASTIEVAKRTGHQAWQLGVVTDEPGKKVHIRPAGLVGQKDRFVRT